MVHFDRGRLGLVSFLLQVFFTACAALYAVPYMSPAGDNIGRELGGVLLLIVWTFFGMVFVDVTMKSLLVEDYASMFPSLPTEKLAVREELSVENQAGSRIVLMMFCELLFLAVTFCLVAAQHIQPEEGFYSGAGKLVDGIVSTFHRVL